MSHPKYLSQSEWQTLKAVLVDNGLTEIYGALAAMNREIELRQEMRDQHNKQMENLVKVFAEQMGKLARGGATG